VSADTAKAIHYARRAGERALGQLAPDEAARWYRQALELHDQAPAGDRSERCELLIGLGDAQCQTGNPEFRQTLLDAAGLAQELGDTDRLCRAVLANTRGFGQTGTVDSERVQTLEAAADALPEADPRRARVLALLALELHYAGEPPRCRALAEEAIEIARAAGDPSTLAHTLNNAIWATSVPETLEQRQRLSDELLELAQHLDDPWLSFWASVRSIMFATDAGDRSRVESGLRAIRGLEASVPHPSIALLRRMYECAWAVIGGDLEAAEQWAIQVLEVATASGEPDAMMLFGAQLVNVRYHQGRAGELVGQIVQFADEPDSLSAWRAIAALALIDSGRSRDARTLATAEDFTTVPLDLTWSIGMFHWSDACCRLGVLDRMGELYELLLPFHGQITSGAGTVVNGSVDWALGRLATTLERYEQAEGHFFAAAELEERFGAPLLLARTRAGWARALTARGRSEDLERAKHMLEQAEETAERLGGGLVTREVAECRAALAAISG